MTGVKGKMCKVTLTAGWVYDIVIILSACFAANCLVFSLGFSC